MNLIDNFCYGTDLSSYDPFDIWKTKWGMIVRKGFYKNKMLFLLPAAVTTLFDYYINNRFRLFYKKQEYPVVRAFAAMSMLNLYEKTNTGIYLKYAKIHIDWLINNYSKGYSGYCWGINFDLQVSNKIFYDKNTPFITNTPYVLEALIKYYKLTNDSSLIKIIKSVFNFLDKDLQVMYETDDELALSYGPLKDRIVTNAVSYAMYSYALLLEFYPQKKEYISNKIRKLFNFIKNHQNANGSWYYEPLANRSFIDCFHSCFVLKNIIKTNKILLLSGSSAIVDKAIHFIMNEFYIKKTGLFKRFAVANKPSFVKYDLYDNAEMLNVFLLLNKKEEGITLNKAIEATFFKGEDIYSVIDLLGFKKNKNTLRWAVMPYLYAVSNL